MKGFVAQVISKPDPPIEELIECCEMIKDQGWIVVIKFDGARASDQYTTFISLPSGPLESMVRSDGSDLKTCLLTMITRFFHQNVE